MINPEQPNINLGKHSLNENAFSLANKRIYLHNKLKFESNLEHVKSFFENITCKRRVKLYNGTPTWKGIKLI